MEEGDLNDRIQKIISNRKIENLQIIKIDPRSKKDDLNMIIIPPGVGNSQNSILQEIKGKPILAISYGDSSKLKSSHVNFYLEDDHIKFEIHTKSLSDSKLKISAQLMRLGKIIED